MIETINRWDVELYKYAEQLFEEQEGIFHKSRNRYKKLNASLYKLLILLKKKDTHFKRWSAAVGFKTKKEH